MEDSLYDLLSLQPSCSAEMVRTRFKAMALRLHPDKNSGSREATHCFQRIHMAYCTLSDPLQRTLYDRSLGIDNTVDAIWRCNAHAAAASTEPAAAKASARPAGGPAAAAQCPSPRTRSQQQPVQRRSSNAAACVQQDTSRGSRPRQPLAAKKHAAANRQPLPAGKPFRHEVELTFLEGVFGCSKQLRVEMEDAPCPACCGLGRTGSQAGRCSPCRGHGTQPYARHVYLQVAPGRADGDCLWLAGQGYPAQPGIRDGDMLVTLAIEWDVLMHRVGHTVWSALTISVQEARTGTSCAVNTVHGEQVVVVPPGAAADDVITLSGYGAPFQSGTRGPGPQICGDHKVVMDVASRAVHGACSM